MKSAPLAISLKGKLVINNNPIIQEGYDSYQNEVARESCPYRPGYQTWKDWNHGYNIAGLEDVELATEFTF